MYKSFFLISIFILASFKITFSQEVTMSKTILYLNKELINKCSFEMKKQLTVEFFKNGTKIRQDKVHPDALDPSLINYIPEENIIKLECIPGYEECFNRIIYQNKIKRYYSRLNIDVTGMDSSSIKGVELALQHLVKLNLDPSYKLYEFFE